MARFQFLEARFSGGLEAGLKVWRETKAACVLRAQLAGAP